MARLPSKPNLHGWEHAPDLHPSTCYWHGCRQSECRTYNADRLAEYRRSQPTYTPLYAPTHMRLRGGPHDGAMVPASMQAHGGCALYAGTAMYASHAMDGLGHYVYRYMGVRPTPTLPGVHVDAAYVDYLYAVFPYGE